MEVYLDGVWRSEIRLILNLPSRDLSNDLPNSPNPQKYADYIPATTST
jgi:hypothetical protein